MIFTKMYVHVRDPHPVRSRSLTATRLGFRSCDLFLFRIIGSSLVLLSQLSLYYFTYRAQLDIQARIQKFFKGGLRSKILKEKCLLIHVSTRVHIKTRQTCNSFSLLPFQEDCLLFFFFALFYYSLIFLKFERGVALAGTVFNLRTFVLTKYFNSQKYFDSQQFQHKYDLLVVYMYVCCAAFMNRITCSYIIGLHFPT